MNEANLKLQNKVKPYTKIWSWITDVSKFGIDSFTPNMIQYMVRRVYDIAGTTDSSIKVYYQSQKIPVKTFVDYCDLYLKDRLVSVKHCQIDGPCVSV